MLVFGDAARIVPLGELQRELNDALRGLAAQPGGLQRHAALVGALIAAGELAQAAADSKAPACIGWAVEALRLTRALAEAVQKSWSVGFDAVGALPPPLASRDGSELSVTVRQPEGFCYYALYPEAYGATAAAAKLAWPVQVLGLRSIGTTLGACVAAATGSNCLLTARPEGHPFARRVVFSPVQRAVIARLTDTQWAVVDEGPGLSGSSFVGAADALMAAGVPMAHIHLFAGHDNPPGQHASRHIRDRWQQLDRHAASFDDLLLHSGRLQDWASALLGRAVAPLRDISGGGWRTPDIRPMAAPAPVHPYWERRKFLFFCAQTWKLKFVGLGRAGAAQISCATMLDQAGFGPPVAGLLHGFLVERWLDGVAVGTAGPERAGFVRHLARYLTFRSGLAAPGSGASVADLFTMAQRNLELALGAPAGAWLTRFRPMLDRLQAQQRPVWTDNRLHAWEWLTLPDGRYIKTDGTDHAAGHDLIGAQDIAWDVVGATVEFDLSEAEQALICAAIATAGGGAISPLSLGFLLPCYLGFQIGSWTMAASACEDPEDRERAQAAVRRYQTQFVARCLNG